MDSPGSPSFSGKWENDLLRHLILEHIQKTGRNVEIEPGEISDVIDRVAPKCAKSLFDTLINDTPEMITHENNHRIVFAADNYSLWKEPFDKLEMMLKISREVVKEFIKDVGPLFNNEERLLFKAISALHGNGCLVAQEIFALMRAGYASGALARWRKMYEIEVTALYLKENGRGVGNDLAQRYLDYSVIEHYKKVGIYAKSSEIFDAHSRKLGYEPYPKEDIDTLKGQYEHLRNTKYDPNYCKAYGWTTSIEKKKKEQIGINDLARAINFGHFYPYYQLANDAVHSGPGSLFWNISLPIHSRDAILIGPTYYGMEEPGQLLAISLNHINFALLSLHPSLIAREIIIINNWLTDEILDALIRVHRVVESSDITMD